MPEGADPKLRGLMPVMARGGSRLPRLEYGLGAGCGILAELIAISTTSPHIIAADDGDRAFHMAIFYNDRAATPEITTTDLRRLRRYIIHPKRRVAGSQPRASHWRTPADRCWFCGPTAKQTTCLLDKARGLLNMAASWCRRGSEPLTHASSSVITKRRSAR